MAAVSIEQTVRTMLTNNIANASIADASITHGYRLQSSQLPALTFTVENQSSATIGIQRISTLTMNIVADTSVAALDLEPLVRAALTPGSYGRTVLAIVNISSSLSEPAVGVGDEQEPAQLSVTADIYWE